MWTEEGGRFRTVRISDCTSCLIDGQWVEAAEAERVAVSDPATGEIVGRVPDCDEADAIRAVEAAERISEDWATTPGVQRERILLRTHDLILGHQDEIARIITLEEGKPLAESRAEVISGAEFARWYASEARRQYGDVIPPSEPDKRLFVFREPLGPVFIITPWNDPFGLVMRKAAPALAAGCPVIIKPSEEAPLSAIAAARLLTEAGIPAGAVNVVTTSRPAAISEVILSHPAVKHVTFTGSTEVGKALGARAGNLVKGMTLELGGHAPFVVFDDADLSLAVSGLLNRKFRNAGQTCSCPSRLFLQEGIAGEFLEAFLEGAKRIVMGHGLQPDVTMGPLINESAIVKVKKHVADAKSKGARLLLGDCPSKQSAGTFCPPVVLTDVRPDMLVCSEETFGPVASFMLFKDEAALRDIVNHPKYGLAAYCYTGDLSRALRMAGILRCGFLGLNDPAPQAVEVPMGGINESGLGREGGRWGIEEFSTTKCVSIRI